MNTKTTNTKVTAYPNPVMNEKLVTALNWLGDRYVFHPNYKSKCRHYSTFEMMRPINERIVPNDSD